MSSIKSICVFCGSSSGSDPEYIRQAQALGKFLAQKKIKLVYGAGNVGLMGELANACKEAGGHVIGIIPQHLVDLEVADHNINDLRIVQTMHERKALMHELSDAFITLPGGIGTLEELFETLTWSQLELHSKPCGILNIKNFYCFIENHLNQMVENRFLLPEHKQMVLIESQIECLFQRLEDYQPQPIAKWVDRHTQRKK